MDTVADSAVDKGKAVVEDRFGDIPGWGSGEGRDKVVVRRSVVVVEVGR